MAIQLYPHNEKAYRQALVLLRQQGKAAIVHPTGSGKSFIAFKFCEEHAGKKICWLSPSVYILETQRESFRRQGGGSLDHVSFLTYARLAYMTKEELASSFDAIILDEFHRCGASEWGKGVQDFLACHPRVPLLGLTATSIRYLDGHRDMADELFDGHVASEISLGEAIVRNILRAPTYIVSIYSHYDELRRYEQRVHASSEAVRQMVQKHLDLLRKALENADGLEEIFDKHMQGAARRGKYIVFCANRSHMEAMIDKARQWFRLVDGKPRIYAAYSENPASSLDFAHFKADKSDHLKLLFCIDMLNEGIHIDGISGVILFRPTISPIIYKQQIGRALSAGGKQTPLIFDIVNNFENLYSIAAIEEEMAAAVESLRDEGREEEILNPSFTLHDTVRDCRELFEQLQESLSPSWETMFDRARVFYREHGHLRIPKSYRTADRLNLGSWIAVQRGVRAGVRPGNLSGEQIERLDGIAMQWQGRSELLWQKNLAGAEEFHRQHGHLDIARNYKNSESLALGVWLINLRRAKTSGDPNLTPERIAQLDALGMIWEKGRHQWEQNFRACSRYFSCHGNLDIPANYIDESGLRLGSWLRRQRRIRNGVEKRAAALSAEQIHRLEEIGCQWLDSHEQRWEEGFAHAKEYFQSHGHLQVPATHICADGFLLGKWLRRHIEGSAGDGKTAILLTPQRRRRLAAIGMVWERRRDGRWESCISLCRQYREIHGDLNIAQSYVAEGIWLGKWLYLQKQRYKKGAATESLSAEEIAELEALGIDWLTAHERLWETMCVEAESYVAQHDTLPASGYKTEGGLLLGRWLKQQRTAWKKGKLEEEQRVRLAAIGLMDWRDQPGGKQRKSTEKSGEKQGFAGSQRTIPWSVERKKSRQQEGRK